MSRSDKTEPHSARRHRAAAQTADRRASDSARTLPPKQPEGEPWDPQSAEELTRIYESVAEEWALPQPNKRREVSGAKTRPEQEPETTREYASLDRLAGIATRLEQSLADINPEKSIEAFNSRLDELEQRFDAALRDVAQRSDVSSLGLIATQAREISAHFDEARTHLARLDAIESQLRDLARQFDEQRPASAATANSSQIEAAIEAAAERAITRLAAAVPASEHKTQWQRIDDLEEVLQEFIGKRHQSEEITSSMLRTIEDALGRISDRLDAMDDQKATPAPSFEDPHAFVSGSPEGESAALDEAYQEGARALGIEASQPALDAGDYSPATTPKLFTCDGGDESLAGDTDPARIIPGTQTLDDLRASAMRAKLKAQAANSRTADPDAKDDVGVARGLRSSLLAGLGGLRSGFLLGVMICLFGAGYLIVDNVTGQQVTTGPRPGSAASDGGMGHRTEAATGKTRGGDEGQGAPWKAEFFSAPDRQATAAEPRPAGSEPSKAQAAGSTFEWVAQVTPSATKASANADRSPLPADTSTPPQRRAANGDAVAQFDIGSRFADGTGVVQDWKQAHSSYQRSAMQGYAPAQFRLGLQYERGLGVATDLGRARVWYRRAAEQGHVRAMHNLAVLTAAENDGTGYAEAAKWFESAAEHGLVDSQFNLGVLYETGRGVAKELPVAYKWFALAAKAGDREAARRLEPVRARLEAAELSSADQKVANWRVQPPDAIVNGPQTSSN